MEAKNYVDSTPKCLASLLNRKSFDEKNRPAHVNMKKLKIPKIENWRKI